MNDYDNRTWDILASRMQHFLYVRVIEKRDSLGVIRQVEGARVVHIRVPTRR
jgi:hypothetical protein